MRHTMSGKCDHNWKMVSDRHYEEMMLSDYDAWDVRGCIECGITQRRGYIRDEAEHWVEMGKLAESDSVSDNATKNYWRGLTLFQGSRHET